MIKNLFKIASCVTVACCASVAQSADWQYGFGTGFGGLKVDGDGGFNTNALGPIDFEVVMDPSDVMEYTDSALALGGFASNGDVTVTYALKFLKLEDDVSGMDGAVPARLDLSFETLGGEILVDYRISDSIGLVGGFRYTSQEYNADITVGQTTASRSVDDNWTDAVVGVSATVPFSNTLSWDSLVDYGFGGSEGTVHANTGLTKRFGMSWVAKLFVDYKDTEYQSGDRGDSDWFYYEAKETVVGLNVLYVF